MKLVTKLRKKPDNSRATSKRSGRGLARAGSPVLLKFPARIVFRVPEFADPEGGDVMRLKWATGTVSLTGDRIFFSVKERQFQLKSGIIQKIKQKDRHTSHMLIIHYKTPDRVERMVIGASRDYISSMKHWLEVTTGKKKLVRGKLTESEKDLLAVIGSGIESMNDIRAQIGPEIADVGRLFRRLKGRGLLDDTGKLTHDGRKIVSKIQQEMLSEFPCVYPQ